MLILLHYYIFKFTPQTLASMMKTKNILTPTDIFCL